MSESISTWHEAGGAAQLEEVHCNTDLDVFVQLSGTEYTQVDLDRIARLVLYKLQLAQVSPQALTVADESGKWSLIQQ